MNVLTNGLRAHDLAIAWTTHYSKATNKEDFVHQYNDAYKYFYKWLENEQFN